MLRAADRLAAVLRPRLLQDVREDPLQAAELPEQQVQLHLGRGGPHSRAADTGSGQTALLPSGSGRPDRINSRQ